MKLERAMTKFDDKNAANDAYEIVRKLHKDGTIEIQDVAALVRQRDGRFLMHDARDVDALDGGLFGIIAGGRSGLIGGPLGSIIGGVAGVVTGAASASLIDLGFPKDDLQALRDQQSPGSSLLIVLLEPVWLDKLDAALASYAGMSMRRTLRAPYAQDAGALEAMAEMREAIADRETDLGAPVAMEDHNGRASISSDWHVIDRFGGAFLVAANDPVCPRCGATLCLTVELAHRMDGDVLEARPVLEYVRNLPR